MPRLVTQDPGERLDYTIDWSAPKSRDNPEGPWLVDGDTIATSTFDVPAGLTQDGESHDDTTATIWLMGGTVGERYAVTNHVVTTAGREGEWTFWVDIRDR
jgi:hypothetical protein